MKINSFLWAIILLLAAILGSLWWTHQRVMDGQMAIRDSVSSVRHMLAPPPSGTSLKNGLFTDETAFNAVQANYQRQYPKATTPISGKDNTIWGYSINPAIVGSLPLSQTSFSIANALDANNDITFYVTASTYQDKKDRCPTFCDVAGCSTTWQELSSFPAPTTAGGGTSQTQNFANTYLTLLPKGITVSRAYYNDIMSQEGCRYVRAYYGMQMGSLCALLVGVKEVDGQSVEMKSGKMYFQDYRSVRF